MSARLRALATAAALALLAGCSTYRGMAQDASGIARYLGLSGPTTNAGGLNVQDRLNATDTLNATDGLNKGL